MLLYMYSEIFVEMARYLLPCENKVDPEVFLLSERISQVLLENYFGQQSEKREE